VSLSAGNVLSVAFALSWVWGIYAYWRRDEKRRSDSARVLQGRSAGGARATEEAERPEVGQAQKGKADPAEPVN